MDWKVFALALMAALLVAVLLWPVRARIRRIRMWRLFEIEIDPVPDPGRRELSGSDRKESSVPEVSRPKG